MLPIAGATAIVRQRKVRLRAASKRKVRLRAVSKSKARLTRSRVGEKRKVKPTKFRVARNRKANSFPVWVPGDYDPTVEIEAVLADLGIDYAEF